MVFAHAAEGFGAMVVHAGEEDDAKTLFDVVSQASKIEHTREKKMVKSGKKSKAKKGGEKSDSIVLEEEEDEAATKHRAQIRAIVDKLYVVSRADGSDFFKVFSFSRSHTHTSLCHTSR